jgi:hypothetical protein
VKADGRGQRFGLPLLFLPLLAACTAVQPLRDDPAPCAVGGLCGQAMIEQAPDYRLGYVQFADDGRYAQAGQLERVLADIRDASDNGLVLVGFTHGWKEDAGADRWSVSAFKSMLAAVSAREHRLAAAQARRPRLVAGVFLGWPGHSATLPGLNGLTWFDRADAAGRIARGDYGDALLRLRQLRDNPPAGTGAPGNQLILVGHSLGANMLYQRLAREPLRDTGVILAPLADLVLLLSPAIPAADARALAELPAADRAVLPPIMAITSEADSTLRLAFPLARWLLDRQQPANGPGGPGSLQAMGVYAPLVTHRLASNGAGFTLVATGAQDDHPDIFQIAASQGVMQGHKDIANPRLVDFIAEVTALQLDNRLSQAALASAFPATAAR